MVTIVVVYHSGYGHTQKQAEAVLSGLTAHSNVKAIRLPINSEGNIPESGWELLAAADTIIFGSPTYMGTVSWQFKKFADASSKAWFEQKWKDKLVAGFTNSSGMNGDKLSTLHYLFTLAMQHSMIWMGTSLMPASSKAAQRNDINFIDSFTGLMAQSPTDASVEEGPLPGDLVTAKKFGERIARISLRWSGGND
ncbi:MAG: flavodoxin family protein [Gammaproteobacteria bacterium]|nr:flavodoxin family protein [Gammaproteobacteria bacterium]